ncbi:MAG: hypothetical protein ABI874_03390, partial [Chloroflexota bacterium]
LALVAQPAPPTFAVGWGAPRRLTPIDLRDSHAIVLAPDQTFHLVWAHAENGAPQIFIARLNAAGDWAQPPTRIGNAGARAVSPQLVVMPDNADVIAYIEKSPQGGLMVTDGTQLPQRIVEAVGDMRQLAMSSDETRIVWVAWSENRDRQPFVYLTRFQWTGRPSALENVRALNADAVLATQPTLLLRQDRLHTFYFADDNKFVDLRYAQVLAGVGRLSGGLAGEPQVISHRPPNAGGAYPIAVRADTHGNLFLFESLGAVRLTRFDVNGTRRDAQPITLDRVRTSSAMDATVSNDAMLIAWSGQTRRDRPSQIFARRFTTDGKPNGDEQRLTFSSSGAFQPHWFADGNAIQHLFWVENVSDSDAALFYANTVRPADVSIWQRLGFGGDNPLANFVFAVAAGFMYAILLLIGNVWRPLIVSLLLLGAHRLARGRVGVLVVVFVASALPLSAPMTELLSQPPIALSAAAHWAFVAPALAVTLWLLRQWRTELSEPLRWAALPFVWSAIYYW